MAPSLVLNLDTFALDEPVDVSDASCAPGYHCDPLSKAAGPKSLSKSVDRSRTSFIMCYLQMLVWVMLRRGTVEWFLLTWLVEQMLADAEITHMALKTREYNALLWFWAVKLGARATKAAGASSSDP